MQEVDGPRLAVVNDVDGSYGQIWSSVPELTWSVAAGDPITVTFESLWNDNDRDDVTLLVTQGEQIVLFEARSVLHSIHYPNGVAFEPLEPACVVPPDAAPCCEPVLAHPVDVTIAGTSSTVLSGQTATVGAYRVLVGRYNTGMGRSADTCACDPYGSQAIDVAVYPVVLP